METKTLNAIAEKETLKKAIELAAEYSDEDVKIGEIRSISNAAQASEYPSIDPALLEFLSQITIIVGTGAAGLKFINELRALLKKDEKSELVEKSKNE